MITVSELAKKSSVTADAVRHYVRIGLLNPIRNENNGYKVFSQQDIDKVRFIRKARRLGYTLSEIGQILDNSSRGQSPCPMVRKIIEQRMEENQRRLRELQQLQQHMEDAVKKWKNMPDGVPDGKCICHLIEAINNE